MRAHLLALLGILLGASVAFAATAPEKIDRKSSAQFLHHVSQKRFAQRGDCVVAAALILDSKHWRRDYRLCRHMLSGLPNIIYEDPGNAGERATRAYAARLFAGVLGIYASYSRRLSPSSGRYAYRDLVAVGLMAPGGGQNPLTGLELVGLVQAAEDWQTRRKLPYAKRVARDGADVAPAVAEKDAAETAAAERAAGGPVPAAGAGEGAEEPSEPPESGAPPSRPSRARGGAPGAAEPPGAATIEDLPRTMEQHSQAPSDAPPMLREARATPRVRARRRTRSGAGGEDVEDATDGAARAPRVARARRPLIDDATEGPDAAPPLAGGPPRPTHTDLQAAEDAGSVVGAPPAAAQRENPDRRW